MAASAPDEPFGVLLARVRRAAGMTQEDLAHASGLSVRAISKLEREPRRPQRRSLEALADALRLTGDERSLFVRRARPTDDPPDPTGFVPVPFVPAPPTVGLPPDLRDFTGRAAETARLGALFDAVMDEHRPGVGGPVAVVCGQPGQGKTALAVHVAHRFAPTFPDGCVFVGMRGEDGALTVREVLTELLTSLAHLVPGDPGAAGPGSPAGATPPDGPVAAGDASVSALLCRYRAALGGRRMLIVLDDAENEAQVRPLAPPDDRSVLLVTSRRVLAGLDAAERIALGELSVEESVALLRAIIGDAAAAPVEEPPSDDRVPANLPEPSELRALWPPDTTSHLLLPWRADAPSVHTVPSTTSSVAPSLHLDLRSADAVERIARLCGGLPLALRIAGNRAASRPGWTVDDVAAELADEARRLDTLRAGDLVLGAAFGSVYNQLRPQTQTAFRRLSVVPGKDISLATAVEASGMDPRDVADAVEELLETGIARTAPNRRFELHRLALLYARRRLDSEEPGTARRAEEQLVRTLIRTAGDAGAVFSAGEPMVHGHRPMEASGSGASANVEARRWLREERNTWLDAVRTAAAWGWHRSVIDLASSMAWYSNLTSRWSGWRMVFGLGVQAAVAEGDRLSEALLIGQYGRVLSLTGSSYDEALRHTRRAEELARRVDPRLESMALLYNGAVHARYGRLRLAETELRLAEETLRGHDYHMGEVIISDYLGWVLRGQGRLDEALATHEHSLKLAAATPADVSPEIVSLGSGVALAELGFDFAALRRRDDAVEAYRDAARHLEAAGHPMTLIGVRTALERCEQGDLPRVT